MKTYRGMIESGAFKVWVNPDDGRDCYWLRARPDLLPRGATTDFRWGVADNRTKSLATAMLADLTGEGGEASIPALLPAWVRFLSCLPDDGFEVNEAFLIAVVYAVTPQQKEATAGHLRGLFGHSHQSDQPHA